MKIQKSILITAVLLCISLIVNAQNKVEGNIRYNNTDGTGISGAVVKLLNNNGVIVNQTISGDDGFYAFTGVANGEYNISVSADIPEGGISPADASDLYNFLTNQGELSPLQMKAADVDENGTVDWDDMNMIMERYIMQINQFPVTWKFEDISFVLAGNKDGVGGGEVKGTTTGDVNGSYSPPQTKGLNSSIIVNRNSILFVDQNNEISVPVTFGQDIYTEGLGLIIDYPASIIDFVSIATIDPSIIYNVKGEKIYIAWRDAGNKRLIINQGQALATLKFRLANNNSGLNFIELGLNNESEIVNGTRDGSIPVVYLPKIGLKNSESGISNVWPNPISSSNQIANMNFYAAEDGVSEIIVIDMLGSVVETLFQGNITEGEHYVNFNTGLYKSGTYYIYYKHSGNTNTYLSKHKFTKVN